MKLEGRSGTVVRWIFMACLAGFACALPLPAQQSGQGQETAPTAQPGQAQPSPSVGQPSPKQDVREEIDINDHLRTYVVHLPSGYDRQQHYPVVILLHGLDQDAAEMARLTHFNDFADQEGIIAVYPNARRGRWNLGTGERRPNGRRHNRGPGGYGQGYPPGRPRSEPEERGDEAPRSPDIRFIHRILDKLSTQYSVDTRRIYAIGLGEGGFMAIRLGCSMADRVAAIAVVGAAMPRMLNCVPSRPTPVLLMNGTDDPIIPFAGGPYKDGTLHLLSAEDSVKRWARLNHCAEKPTESTLPALQEGGKDTKVLLFDNCQEGAQVALYGVQGGGHTWPGGEQYLPEKEIGKTSNALNANETIWSFLVSKKIAGETGVER